MRHQSGTIVPSLIMRDKSDSAITMRDWAHVNQIVTLKNVVETDVGLTKRAGLDGTVTNVSASEEVIYDIVYSHEVYRALLHRLKVGDCEIIVTLGNWASNNPAHHRSPRNNPPLCALRHEGLWINQTKGHFLRRLR